MFAGLFLNLLFSLEDSTQNLLELTIFGFTKIPNFSIPNCLYERIPEYSTSFFPQTSRRIPRTNFEKKTSDVHDVLNKKIIVL